MAEFHQPVAFFIVVEAFRTTAARVAAFVIQQSGVFFVALREHFQCQGLESVQGQRFRVMLQPCLGFVAQGAHPGVADDAQALQWSQLRLVDALLAEHSVEQVASVAIGQAVLEDAEVAPKRLFGCYEEVGLQRQIQGRDGETRGKPLLVVTEHAAFPVGRQGQLTHGFSVVFDE